jgi:translation initiation factor IF-1
MAILVSYLVAVNSEMEKEKLAEVIGTVDETLPNALFRVTREDNREQILAYLSGKMRKFRVKVLVGDKVRVFLDPYGGKGRIIRRL